MCSTDVWVLDRNLAGDCLENGMCRYDEMNMKEGVCMSKKKKQHYIPRFLLKNFADQMPIPIRNGCIFRIDLEKRTLRTPQIKHECVKKSLYECREILPENYLEDMLGRFEDQWAIILKKLIAKQTLIKDETIWLYLFLTFQLLRMPDMIKLYEEYITTIIIKNKIKMPVSLEDMARFLLFAIKYNKDNTIVIDLCQRLQYYDINLWYTSKTYPFILNSIMPIFTINVGQQPLVWFCPIASTCCMVMTKQSQFDEYCGVKEYHDVPKNIVDFVNDVSVRRDSPIVYTNDIVTAKRLLKI